MLKMIKESQHPVSHLYALWKAIQHSISGTEPTKDTWSKEDIADHKGVAAVIKNNKGQVLMQNHKKIDKWTIPVGKVDAGDTPLGTIRKEIKEETGLKVRKAKLIGRALNEYGRGGRNTKVDSYLYEVKEHSGKARNLEPHKHLEQRWLSPKEIKAIGPDNLSDMTNLWLSKEGSTGYTRWLSKKWLGSTPKSISKTEGSVKGMYKDVVSRNRTPGVSLKDKEVARQVYLNPLKDLNVNINERLPGHFKYWQDFKKLKSKHDYDLKEFNKNVRRRLRKLPWPFTV